MGQVGVYEQYPYGHIYKYLDPTMTLPSTPAWDLSFFGVGSALHNTENQYVLNIQGNISVDTGAPADYEKAGILSMMKTADPSGATLRDIVGIDGRGYINPVNATGRAWGMLAQAMVLGGGVGDGMLCGMEIDIRNFGTDQPLIETGTSKYGLQIVSKDGPATCAVFLTRVAPGAWNKGLMTKQAYIAVGGTFLELEGLFTVDRYGILTCQAERYGNETKTIAGGIITVTKSDVLVDTEAGAATDDLDTINGGVVGQILTLRSVNSARDIVIKNMTGNIHCMGADRTLLDVYYRAGFMYNGTLWVMTGKNF